LRIHPPLVVVDWAAVAPGESPRGLDMNGVRADREFYLKSGRAAMRLLARRGFRQGGG